MNKELIRETFQRLIVEGKEGFTLDLDGNEYNPPKGYAVGWASFDSIDSAILCAKPGQYIGWWIDPDTKETFIEVVDVFESNMQAFLNAMVRKEKAMYDFANDKVIDLSGFTIDEDSR